MEAGDWVRCISIRSSYCGWTGYVEWIKPPECKVILTLDDYDRPVRIERRALMRDFVVDNEIFLTDENIDALIDISLDMRDEAWFRDLVKRRERGKVGETL
ncbi:MULTISPECIES: hypothetical protein [Geobacillus]|uniref:hypothetical protein n=1 Tax=Geobacillus TaxID=129337 RepID=UPI0006E4CF9E|nr:MULTISPECIES: hypothetical protein [Geobacillus]KQB91911.1 hypothetical protein GEPA3_3050 [Geobacillus sp. PA-3]MED4916744.1 hypothetical protein [Geobacillus thermodenitrificans]